MKKALTIIVVVGSVFVGLPLISIFHNPATRQKKNVEYMRNTLGDIVLEYAEKYGDIPDTFEAALNDSSKTLPNRGDYYGGALVYEKLSDKSFRFVALGKNNRYDQGKSDDVVVMYVDGIWANNLQFIKK